MLFAASLFCQVLLATAIPTREARLAARVTARAERSRLSHPKELSAFKVPTNVSHAEFSTNWAGAVLESAANTFKSVTGTFVVPVPSEPSGGGTSLHSASAWVGIDGDTCQTAILQTGIDFTIANGRVSYDAWYEFFPDFAHDFTGISISAGDTVQLTVTASSLTSGTAVIHNLSTGQTVSKAISSTAHLCQANAEWIVEDFESGGSLVPLADFGTVTFSNAHATTSSGTVGPAGAVIINMEQNGQVLTSASTSSSGVTVQYIA
ncbi:hypothetical protein D9615_004962 [Tricholomella constricta]|uniref:Acid proteinase n=1 Tax=Tricholomella constricta TaxID=117010 RepID=A0A8H5HH47_9AGAR|nr:hypothetical protein D9615_004962 [Tricholomella constricta]